jgi:predicted RNA binding protein YcfA (HicA-like mRNA interferase family)
MPLKLEELIEYLEAHDGLGPAEQDDLWPGYDEEQGDLYLIDWRRLFGSERNEPLFPDPDIEEFDGSLVEEIGSAMGQGPPVDEAQAREVADRRPEICAWYQPITFHAFAWGIFLREDCLRSIAADIARWVPPLYYQHPATLAPELLRMSFASLYLHERYHHKTEAHAVRLLVAEQRPCYRSYWNKVYARAARSGGGGPLEEALANADSYRSLGERTYRRFVSSPVYEAAQEYLRWRFPFDPPGYCDAPMYLRDPDFEAGQNLLKSQVQEAVAHPRRTVAEWQFAPNMNESLFGITSDIWLVVPAGRRPTVPTFPLYRPVSTTNVLAALKREFGYAEVKGGKGSHVKLKARELPTQILPDRKDLPPHVLKNIANSLRYRDIGDLLAELGL